MTWRSSSQQRHAKDYQTKAVAARCELCLIANRRSTMTEIDIWRSVNLVIQQRGGNVSCVPCNKKGGLLAAHSWRTYA